MPEAGAPASSRAEIKGQSQRAETPGSAPAGTSADTILAVRNLHKEFGGVRAVDGTTFDVTRGSITGLIGPNGAGKSTAINVVAGFYRPSSGEVLYRGADIAGLHAYQIARRGLIRTFQLSSEFARLTVMENLLVAAIRSKGNSTTGALLGKRHWRADQAANVARARELLERFGLSASVDKYAGELSGGQKRLLEIMRAVMAEPQLLLLDEPFAGVNPSLALEVQNRLIELREGGLTMLMVEHELAAVERMCDTVVVMAQGRVLAEGTMAELRENELVLDAYLT
jgi:ABC-type branched-subunit amino acid transport system ATPase component